MCIIVGVNVQMYSTTNTMMNIQIVSTGIDVIELAIAILTVQFALNENRLTIKLINFVIKCSK